MEKIFDIIPGWVYCIAVVCLCVLLGFSQMQTAKARRDLAAYRSDVAQAALKAEQDARAKENVLRQQVERIAANAQARTQDLVRRTSDANAALAGLRDTIARINSDSNSAATPGAHEASSARELLGACATEYRSVAEGADALRDQVTALQEYAASVSKNE